LSPKTRINPEARRQTILENILTHSYEELAKLCGCCKRTIIRDIKQWKAEGGFEELLFNEFLKLYPQVKESNPEKALDKLVYLMGKGMTQKQEIKTEGNLNVTGLNEGINSIIKFSQDESNEG